jgi:hypothetical protein
MAVFTRVKTWVSNEVLTASDLNGEFNNILNNMDPDGIEDYSNDVSQMQSTADPGGLGTESLASTLAGEIQRLRFAIKRIAAATQWYVAPISNLGTGGIVTASLADEAVTTAKIDDGAVTKPKLAALGQQISASCGTFTTTSASFVDVTNLSVSITTTGRPVYFGLIYGGSNSQFLIRAISSESDISGNIAVLRDATTVFSGEIGVSGGSSNNLKIRSPVSVINGVDVVAAGTYTYKVRVARIGGITTEVGLNEAKLVVYEL